VSEFRGCADKCIGATCQFVRYSKNKDFSWLQLVNVFGLYWGVFFFSAYSQIVLAGVFAQVQKNRIRNINVPYFATSNFLVVI
jgi:hypothetical protein